MRRPVSPLSGRDAGEKRGRGRQHGEVSEWFKEPVLKTGDPATGHGFESHPLRHINNFSRRRPEIWVISGL